MKVAVLRDISEKEIAQIRAFGVDVVKDNDYSADIIFCRDRVENVGKYKNLKWIHGSFVGVDKFLTDEIKRSDILITNSKGAYNSTVSEHALALMLAINRGLNIAIPAQQKKEWTKFEEADELYGKKVGIVGSGDIGSSIARLCKAFGCKTLGMSRSNKKPRPIDILVPKSRLHDLLKESDYVVVSLPLTPETKHLIGKKEFTAMKKTSVLINIGRGQVIDEKELVKALKNGKIAGAGLDVFEEEPLSVSSELWSMKNVIITAHYAGYTPQLNSRLMDIFCTNLREFLKTGKLSNAIDKKKGY